MSISRDITKLPLLTDLPEGEVRSALAAARRRSFANGEVVFHEADRGDTLHLVTKGCFAARVSTPTGKSAILAIFGPGDSFGELVALREDARREATVISLESGKTLSIDRPPSPSFAGRIRR